MIISRAALRVTLGGGGSDLPQYIEKFKSGASLTATINKYIYVAIHKSDRDWIVKYSKYEKVNDRSFIKHDIVRETLDYMINHGYIEDEPLEIASFADISGRSGLGSSGAFSVALVGALMNYNKDHIDISNTEKYEIARVAFRIAQELGHVTGAQDFYASCFGGMNCIFYDSLTDIEVENINKFIPYCLYLYDLMEERDTEDVLKQITYEDCDVSLKQRGMNSAMNIAKNKWDDLFKSLEDQDRRKYSIVNEKREIESKADEIRQKYGVECVKTIGAGQGGYLLVFSSIEINESDYIPIEVTTNGIGVSII